MRNYTVIIYQNEQEAGTFNITAADLDGAWHEGELISNQNDCDSYEVIFNGE